jgi:hypothetical protein
LQGVDLVALARRTRAHVFTDEVAIALDVEVGSAMLQRPLVALMADGMGQVQDGRQQG